MTTRRALVAGGALALALAGCGRTDKFGDLAPTCVRDVKPPPLGQRMVGDHVIAWNVDHCLRVTVQPDLSTKRPLIQQALRAWSTPSCTALCFEAPVDELTAPTAATDARIHFARDEASTGQWALVHDDTGGILNATAWVSQPTTLGELLNQVGSMLGFVPPAPGADSALGGSAFPSAVTQLGALDTQSVCAAYPPCR